MVTNKEKIRKHEDTIYTFAFAAAGAGVGGAFVPAGDLTVIGISWAQMINIISENSGKKTTKDSISKLIASVIASGAAMVGGIKMATAALHFLPGFGTLGVIGINAFLNFLYTVRLGNYVAIQMENPDFDTTDWASLIPDITAMVFGLPSVAEIKETLHDMNHKR